MNSRIKSFYPFVVCNSCITGSLGEGELESFGGGRMFGTLFSKDLLKIGKWKMQRGYCLGFAGIIRETCWLDLVLVVEDQVS